MEIKKLVSVLLIFANVPLFSDQELFYDSTDGNVFEGYRNQG